MSYSMRPGYSALVLTVILAVAGFAEVRAEERRPPEAWLVVALYRVPPPIQEIPNVAMKPARLLPTFRTLDSAHFPFHLPSLPGSDVLRPPALPPRFTVEVPDPGWIGELAPLRIPMELPSNAWDAAALRSISQDVLLERLSVSVAEAWLRVYADTMRTLPAERDFTALAERAWGFWRRARPDGNTDAFIAWLEGRCGRPYPEIPKLLWLARLAQAENAHARSRDLIRPRIDDPAFAGHRDELLLLLGMAETQLDDPAGEETLKRLVADYPDSPSVPRARLLLAWAAMMDGRNAEATEHLRLLLAANPEEALARRARQMLLGMGAGAE